jgi:hypothetical protein
LRGEVRAHIVNREALRTTYQGKRAVTRCAPADNKSKSRVITGRGRAFVVSGFLPEAD